MKCILYCGVFLLCAASPALAQKSGWRQATTAELESVLPARAPVESEHIETEMRTASGIVDAHKHFIAGVVLITAGYSADGKYSHYLLVQAPVEIGGVALKPGEYALGWNREVSGQALSVHINRWWARLRRIGFPAQRAWKACASGLRAKRLLSRSAASAFRISSATKFLAVIQAAGSMQVRRCAFPPPFGRSRIFSVPYTYFHVCANSHDSLARSAGGRVFSLPFRAGHRLPSPSPTFG